MKTVTNIETGHTHCVYEIAADIHASMMIRAEKAAAADRETWEDPTIQADPDTQWDNVVFPWVNACFEGKDRDEVLYAIETKIAGEW